MSNMLKRARQHTGLTIKELAEKADISRATVNNAERGQAIRYEYAQKIVNTINQHSGTSYTVEELGISTTN